jgi:SAM-dependent methyltransferase
MDDYELFAADTPYRRWLVSLVADSIGRRVLEVGVGVGGWTDCFPGRELWFGIDNDPRRLERARSRHAGAAVRFEELDIADDQSLALAENQFDTVLCVNTLEHVADDVRALINMHAVLVDGGRLVLVVPAIPALFGPLDRRYGHHRRYDRDGLAGALTQAGFSSRRLRYFNLLGAVGWFVHGRAFGGARPPAWSFALFNRLLPACALLDRLVGPPLGLSLIAIAHR